MNTSLIPQRIHHVHVNYVILTNETATQSQVIKIRDSVSYLVNGMEQWIARRTVVPFVVQFLGSSPLQNIRSPKETHVYD